MSAPGALSTTSTSATSLIAPPATPPDTLDLDNIQGDILSGLPKKTQSYIFFQIVDVTKFRADLARFVPFVKTVAGVLKDRDLIKEHKKKGHKTLIPLVGVNIAFSHLGFVKLGIDDSSLGGATDPFIIGQFKDSTQNLGDAGTQTTSGLVPNWDTAFVQPLHGVILISGESHETLHKKKLEIECIFGVRTIQPSIFEVTSLRGDVRPGVESGHEHFGFLDGISNPAVTGFDKDPNPGPVPVNPGVIVTGHTGDLDQATRAAWAVDGSFLVFRYLFQQVPEFNDFLQKNPIAFQDLTPEEGSDLLGARLVGRWKSGAPIDLSPFKDDPMLAADPKRNNDFKIEGEINSQFRCPFAAHVRRTNPRNDLEALPPPVGPISVQKNRILRRGVQFGPELTKEEKTTAKTEYGRGLLFACYQTSITNGFQFLQKAWANNPKFPLGQTQPEEPGLDPLIGQGVRSMSGTDPNNEEKVINGMPDFIIPRGGEYFFSPSLKGLRETLASPPVPA